MAKHALKSVHPTHNKMKLIIPIITAGALLSCTAAIAQADTGQNNTSVATQQNATSLDFEPVVASTPEVSAPTVATLSFERPVVTTSPAPKPVVPVVEASKAATPDATATTTATPAVAQAVANTTAAVSPSDPANIPATPGESNGTTGAPDAFGAKIVAAALAQADANVQQDCTALVSNSLRAVGIDFHGWPKDYEQLGQITTNPQPGDLIYYKNGGGAAGMAHIALYIGGGKAVHGGWDGHSTKIWSVNVGSGPIYIHVTR